jgi:hypothetical protein
MEAAVVKMRQMAAARSHPGNGVARVLRRRSCGTLANERLVSKQQLRPSNHTTNHNDSSSSRRGKGKCGARPRLGRHLKLAPNQSHHHFSGSQKRFNSWNAIRGQSSAVLENKHSHCPIIPAQAAASTVTTTTLTATTIVL